jgi:hypothetical protein
MTECSIGCLKEVKYSVLKIKIFWGCYAVSTGKYTEIWNDCSALILKMKALTSSETSEIASPRTNYHPRRLKTSATLF